MEAPARTLAKETAIAATETEFTAEQVGWRFAGFPTVTGTCKPLASPVAKAFKGVGAAADFVPVRVSDDRPARKDVLELGVMAVGRDVAAGVGIEEVRELQDHGCTFGAHGHGRSSSGDGWAAPP